MPDLSLQPLYRRLCDTATLLEEFEDLPERQRECYEWLRADLDALAKAKGWSPVPVTEAWTNGGPVPRGAGIPWQPSCDGCAKRGGIVLWTETEHFCQACAEKFVGADSRAFGHAPDVRTDAQAEADREAAEAEADRLLLKSLRRPL